MWPLIHHGSKIAASVELSLIELHQVRRCSPAFVRAPEQFDSVTALTGAALCDEWAEAQPFEVIKQRKVGPCVAVCQRSSRGQKVRGGVGGLHMITNGLWL